MWMFLSDTWRYIHNTLSDILSGKVLISSDITVFSSNMLERLTLMLLPAISEEYIEQSKSNKELYKYIYMNI